MKILIVDELCYPQLGGQQVRFKELAEKWNELGHAVEIVAIDHVGNLPEKEVINGVVYNRPLHDRNYYKKGKFGRNLSSIFKYTIKLKKFFRQDWDLIIFNQFPMLPQLYYHQFFRGGATTVIDFVEHRNSALWRAINKRILNAVDKVVCISDHVKDCASLYRKDDQLFVIPSLVDTSASASQNKESYVFLGRLEQHKHPEHAVEAVLAYNKKYGDNKAINIMGDGNLLSRLQDTYKNCKNVKFHGSVDDNKKAEIFSQSRLLILPSEREGLPKVVIEAMSYGIPTLTTAYEGNGTQFFVKKEGIGLVAGPNVEDLADTINKIELEFDKFSAICNYKKINFDLTLNSKKYLELVKNK